jgi:HIRAN domain-containing protein
LADRLYVAWQDEKSRSWHTIACLDKHPGEYALTFTRGAKKFDAVLAKLFRFQPGYVYLSDELLPVFRNKVPSRNRPDFIRMAEWLGVKPNASDFDLLAAFGRIPGSDSTLTYPEPDVKDGTYRLQFFVHGIRHMESSAIVRSEQIRAGDSLLPLFDVQNPFDAEAVALRTERDMTIIGFVPAFYAADFRKLLADPAIASKARFSVVRNNMQAPIQLKLLCNFESPVPLGFRPLATVEHELFVEAPLNAQRHLSL